MSLSSVYEKYALPDKGGDKGTQHSYIGVYSKLIPSTARSILEIGVYRGHSLAMWQEYAPNATVVGVDVNTERVEFDVDVRRADATNSANLSAAIGEQKFEYIIDDGSHRVYDQIASFDLLWSSLERKGVYIIEDVQGPDALRVLTEYIGRRTSDYDVYDLRAEKNRYDDILVVIRK